jgi:hypothetical protein
VGLPLLHLLAWEFYADSWYWVCLDQRLPTWIREITLSTVFITAITTKVETVLISSKTVFFIFNLNKTMTKKNKRIKKIINIVLTADTIYDSLQYELVKMNEDDRNIVIKDVTECQLWGQSQKLTRETFLTVANRLLSFNKINEHDK